MSNDPNEAMVPTVVGMIGPEFRFPELERFLEKR